MKRNTVFDELKAILLAEHEALLSGDLPALGDVADRKEAAAALLAHQRLSATELQEIESLSQRSARLIPVVSRAVKEVRDYLIQSQTTPETCAYGANGERESLSTIPNRLAQKV